MMGWILLPSGQPLQRDEKIHAHRRQPVILRNNHLVLWDGLCHELWPHQSAVAWRYLPSDNELQLFAVSWAKIYRDAEQAILKTAGPNEKAVALHKVLIDHNIPDFDRPLPYVIAPLSTSVAVRDNRVLKVTLQ